MGRGKKQPRRKTPGYRSRAGFSHSLRIESLEPREMLDAGPLVISEFLTKASASNPNALLDGYGAKSDWIEIYNPTATSVDLLGYYLTDDAGDLTKCRFTADSFSGPSTIGVHEYKIVFAAGQSSSDNHVVLDGDKLHTNFALKDSPPEYLALVQPDGFTVSAEFAPTYPAQIADVSYGWTDDGTQKGFFFEPSPGTANGNEVSAVAKPIIINEIMYHPGYLDPGETGYIPENTGEEYIELYNKSSVAIDVGGWQITKGVDYTIPANIPLSTTIAGGGYLVIAADAAAFNAKYPTVTNYVGGWTGQLGNNGEQIELSDQFGNRVDSVTYASQGDWALRRIGDPIPGQPTYWRGWQWTTPADAGKMSLELVNAAVSNNYGQNWAASTTGGGTPGAANSRRDADSNTAPIVLDLAHAPLIPKSTEAVTVTAKIVDEATTGLTVTLSYRVDQPSGTPPLAFTVATMYDDGPAGGHGDLMAGDGVFSAVLPAQPDNAIVEFYVRAEDSAGNVRTWPGPSDDVGTQGANALYQVDDTVYLGDQPIYRIIVPQAEWTAWNTLMGQDAQLNSMMNATFIAVDGNDTQLRYLTGVRNRGQGTRTRTPHNLQVEFADDHTWEGYASMNLNTQYTESQVAGNAIFAMAGLPAAYGTPVQVRINSNNLASSGSPQFGSYFRFEPYGTEWAAVHFPEDSNGNLYKGIQYPGWADLTYRGATPSSYQDGRYIKETNVAADDWADLVALCTALDPIQTPDAAYAAAVSAIINVDEWVNYFAVDVLVGNRENSLGGVGSQGIFVGDDYSLYRGLLDPRFQFLIHDMDTVLGEGDYPTTNKNLSYNFTIWPFSTTDTDNVDSIERFLKFPEFAPLYYAALKNQIDTTFSAAKLEPLLDQLLGGWVPQTTIDSMKAYAANRVAYVLTGAYNGVVPDDPASIPLPLSIGVNKTSLPATSNGYPKAATSTISLSGRANAIDTRSVKVNGVTATWSAWEAKWTANNVALNPGINRVLIQSFNADGHEIDRSFVDIWRETAVTYVPGGTISSNTAWSPAGGPYYIQGALTIASGATLTIQPGTTVYLASGSGVNLTVASGGRLLAEGTDTQRIFITSQPATPATSWGHIVINGDVGTPETRIGYAHIANNSSTAIDSVGGTVFLDHLTFGTTNRQYLVLDDSSFVVQDCEFPATTGSFEPVHGVGDIKAGGRGLFLRNFWGPTDGYNDSIDYTGGQRSASPILQFIDNVFVGADDDNLDLDGTDAWVEGNIFLHVHKNGPPDTSSGVSGGSNGSDTSQITIINNIFYDVDQAANAKQGNFYTFINNTVVRVTHEGGLDTDDAVIVVQDNGMTEALGSYFEGNIIYDADKLVRDQVASVVTFNNNILPIAWTGPGAGNTVGDPLFVHVPQMSETVFTNWKQAQVIRDWLKLRSTSPAIGTGPNGTNKGVQPLGASISGEPSGTTNLTSATLTVGINRTGYSIPTADWPVGSGFTHYKYRLDGGAWSAETPIATPIALTGLGNGQHYVEVVGKNDAGLYQNDPVLGSSATVTRSHTWTVDTSFVSGPSVRINEILADNAAAVPHNVGPDASYPDVVELYNNGVGTMNLADMSLSDDPLLPRKFVFAASTTLAQGQYLLLYGGTDTVSPQNHLGFALHGNGDALYLYASPANGGGLVDSVAFGVQLVDHSIGRLADGTWGLTEPTLGAANVMHALGNPDALKINEWLAAEVVTFPDDYVELYNPDPLPVDLGGMYLTDNPAEFAHLYENFPTAAAALKLAPLSFIAGGAVIGNLPVGAFQAFIADGNTAAGANHVPFKLSAFQGMIGLFDADRGLVDQIYYGPQKPDVSQGRTPLGADTWSREAIPTRGLENTGVTYGGTATSVTTTVIGSYAQNWYYLASATDPNLPGTWTQYLPAASETWSSGPGLLYLETNTNVSPRNTALAPSSPNKPYTTYYFRTHFTYSGSLSDVTSFTLTTRVDDGALLYLNGVPLYNIRMPTSGVTYSTYTSGESQPPSGDAASDEVWSITATPELKAALRNGDNVLAVEVHQCNSGSSDIVWGAKLDVVRSTGGSTVLRQVDIPPSVAALNGSLRITEVMYNPLGDGDLEYIDLQNVGTTTLDLAGVRLTGAVDFTFPAMLLAPGQFVVVCRDVQKFSEHFGSGINLAGQYGGNLDDGGEQIVLQLPNPYDAAILRFDYNNTWYPTTDGGGYALTVADTGALPAAWDGFANWQAGTVSGGSPGRSDAGAIVPSIVINEVLPHTDEPFVDAIELYNSTDAAIDITGWYLSDDAGNFQKFQIPALPGGAPRMLGAHEYAVFYQGHWVNHVLTFDPVYEFGGTGPNDFGLNAYLGDQVWLTRADTAGNVVQVADYVEFGPSANPLVGGVYHPEPFGRWSTDTANLWKGNLYPLTAPTLGSANDAGGNGPRVGPLVISEIMYNVGAVPNANDLEFVEIHNPTSSSVDLTHWRLSKGVDFDFALGATLDSHQTLVVVSFDPADPLNAGRLEAFRTHYGIGTSVNIVGGFSGHLSDLGEKVQLQNHDEPPLEDPTLYPSLIEDEIVYSNTWGASGNGLSLQRTGTTLWGDDPASWAAAAATPGSVGVVPASVAGRHIFYNRSAFDGGDAAANAADDNAVATDKTALQSGKAGFANYTSYTRGINGIMVDLAGAANPLAIAAADFAFRVGNVDSLAAWTDAPPPLSVSVRLGAGVGGSDRVTIVWADNAIQNQWLQVTVKATANTGLAADDAFYFGNAVGDSGAGNTADYALVDAQDEAAVRAHRTGFAPTSIVNVYDFDRDRRVGASDELTPRYLPAGEINALRLVAPTAAVAMSATAAPAVPEVDTQLVPKLPLGNALPRSSASEGASAKLELRGDVFPSGSLGTSKGDVPTRLKRRAAASAHDAALTSAAWLWAWEWEQGGSRKTATKKDSAAVSAVDRVLAAEWV